MRVFSFGASTAQGAKDTEGGFIVRVGRSLGERGMGSAENFGIGGQTTDDMVTRLPYIPIADPSDLAIVTLGCNDVARSGDSVPEKRVPLDRHARNVRTILEELDLRCRVLYVTQYPIDFAAHGIDEMVFKGYVDAGRRAAVDLGIGIIDIHAEIDDGKFRRFMDDDGMHFNSAGHEYIAERILSADVFRS